VGRSAPAAAGSGDLLGGVIGGKPAAVQKTSGFIKITDGVNTP